MRNLFLIIFLYIMVSPVWATIDCNSIFPGPIQSYSTGGTLYMQENAKIENYNSQDVCFRRLKNEWEMHDQACGIGKCLITNIASQVRSAPSMLSSTDAKSYTIAPWVLPTVTLGTTVNYGLRVSSTRWDIGPVTLNDGAMNVSDSYTAYVLKGVTLFNNSSLVLTAGKTYIIDGDFYLNSGVVTLVGSGQTSFYVRGDFTIERDSVFTGASDMDIFVGGALYVKGNANVQDSYYVAGDAVLQEQVVLTGRLSAKNVTMQSSSKVIYDDGQPKLQCFNDNFDSSSLKPEWVVKTSKGSFSPSIKEGRLRLTENKNDQATSLTYLKLFPAANNLVTVEFDHSAYGGTGADGIAMVLSDAKITPQPGAFGGPLGYGHKGSAAPGFAGGWLGVGIDEFGNFSAEGGSNNQTRRNNSIAIRGSGSATTGYRYLYGSPTLNPSIHNGNNYPNPPHRYRLTVDSRSGNKTMVSIDRNTGAGYAAVPGIPTFDATANGLGQSPIPENFYLSFTGSTGGSNNIHDIDNVKICALKVNPVGVQVHHFEFAHSGQAITCQPEEITIKACANEDCSQLMSGTVTAALTPHPFTNGGWSSGSGLNNVNNGVVTITGGTTKVMLSNYSANSITMGVSSSTPPLRPQSDTLCRSGSLGPAKQYCTLPFADTALRFNVPTFYAGASGVTSIRAIKSNDAGATKVCVPLLTGNQTLQFASTKVVSEASSAVPMVNSTALTPSGNVTVAFNSDGVGQLTVQYPDAGVLRLDATFQKNDVTGTLKLTGSDTVAVIPKAIALQAQGQSGCSGSNDNTYAACPVYRKAGESFTLQARALNEQDQLTPGFATSNKAVSWALLAPAAGGTGAFSPTAITLASGVANVTANWSEVGVIRLGVSNFVPYPAYQDESPKLEVPMQWSAPVGRFIPADFNLVSGDIVPACTAFTYMGQPFGVTLDVLARNTTGGQTRNYTGPFAKGSAFLSVANNKDGKSLSSRLRSLPPLPWLDGRAALTTGSSEFVRLSGTQPDGPYKSLLFGLYMRDNDGDRTLIASPNFNDAVVGNCSGSGCNARQIDSVPMKAYFGRLLAGTAAGLASAPLAVPVQMQYYEAGSWLLNKEDKCTQLSLANQGFTFLNPSQTFDAATRELNLGAGRKIALGLGASPPGGESAQAKDGEILFHFARPDISVRIPYKVELAKQPSSPLWLSDPTSAKDGNLQGEAIFGSSRGNDRIIYRREVLH